MDQLELTLSGHAYLGSSFGRDSDGRVIFVPFSIPGERVRVEITESHKRWARGTVLELIEPSPDRIVPRCQHFADCGGCHYQHFPYHLQLEAKADVLRSQFQRIGGVSELPIKDQIPSPSPWHTRNHVQFSLDPNGKLGFRAAQSDRVVPIQECHLPEEEINTLWPVLDISPIPGLDRIALRQGNLHERMIILHSSEDPDIEMEITFPASVVWQSEDKFSVLAGEQFIQTTILGREYKISAGSFFQVHSRLTPTLVNLVIDALKINEGSRIYDLYAGVGLFSAFIAEAGASVTAVELSSWASSDFTHNLKEFDTVELHESAVEDAIHNLAPNPDAVLVDPPRAGLGLDVVQGIIELSPSRIVYVSCDPTTLARDSKALDEGGYNLQNIHLIDLFPQTFHIETVSLWEKYEG